MIERRRERRIKEANRISLEYLPEEPDEGRKTISFGMTEDISLSGLRILTDAFFPVDKIIKISLSLGRNSEMINMIGRVKWIESFGDDVYEIGFEFEDMLKESIKVLARHLYEKTV